MTAKQEQSVKLYDVAEIKRLAMRVSAITLLVNALLTAIKLAAGVVASSGAMISDAVHSASDVLSTLLVMFGVNMAARAEDSDHPYGHERLECVTALLLSIMLLATGLGIGVTGIKNIGLALRGELAAPGLLALWAALLSILIKEWMFHYTKRAAKRTDSGALLADAWHHRSDALSSVGSFVGVLGARLGWPILDPIAALVIALFIVKVAFDIAMDAFDKMVDHACDDETVAKIRQLALTTEGVLTLDELKTRRFGSKSYVDIEIGVQSTLSLIEAHNIAEALHDRIETEVPEVKHCMVHVNPSESRN